MRLTLDTACSVSTCQSWSEWDILYIRVCFREYLCMFSLSTRVFIQGSAGKKGARGLTGSPGIEVSSTPLPLNLRGKYHKNRLSKRIVYIWLKTRSSNLKHVPIWRSPAWRKQNFFQHTTDLFKIENDWCHYCFIQGRIGAPGLVGLEGYPGLDGPPGPAGLQGLPGKQGRQVIHPLFYPHCISTLLWGSPQDIAWKQEKTPWTGLSDCGRKSEDLEKSPHRNQFYASCLKSLFNAVF